MCPSRWRRVYCVTVINSPCLTSPAAEIQLPTQEPSILCECNKGDIDPNKLLTGNIEYRAQLAINIAQPLTYDSSGVCSWHQWAGP